MAKAMRWLLQGKDLAEGRGGGQINKPLEPRVGTRKRNGAPDGTLKNVTLGYKKQAVKCVAVMLEKEIEFKVVHLKKE